MKTLETRTEITRDTNESVCPHCGWKVGYDRANRPAAPSIKARYHIIM